MQSTTKTLPELVVELGAIHQPVLQGAMDMGDVVVGLVACDCSSSRTRTRHNQVASMRKTAPRRHRCRRCRHRAWQDNRQMEGGEKVAVATVMAAAATWYDCVWH